MDILKEIQVDKNCPICLSLIINPHICNQCHNKYCYNCVKNITIFPLCRTNLLLFLNLMKIN